MSQRKPTLALLPSPSSAGSELQTKVVAEAERLGFSVTVYGTGSAQRDCLYACLCDDAVVIDATPEPENVETYRIMTEQPNAFWHVLGVSRSYLPINFQGLRRGGAPKYPYPFRRLGDDEPPAAWGNQEILHWITEQLLSLREEPRGTRLGQEYRNQSTVEAAGEIGRVTGEMITESLAAAARARGPHGEVFFSYRTSDFRQVQRLAEDLQAGKLINGQLRRAAIILPGELVYERELLSPMRRWQILGLLEDQIRAADEIWVYPNEKYFESWWTRGELVCAAYRPTGTGPEVKVFDPATRQTTAAGEAYLPSLSEKDNELLTRYLTNTREVGLGPETTESLRKLRLLYQLGLGQMVSESSQDFFSTTGPLLDASFGSLLEGESMWQHVMEMISNPEAAKEYLESEVFSEEFWSTLSVPVQDGKRSRVQAAEFLSSSGWETVSLSPQQLRVAVGEKQVLQIGPERVRISEQPPRYIWHATRNLGKIGGLEELPTFVTVPADEPPPGTGTPAAPSK